jgi:hypothetical protein
LKRVLEDDGEIYHSGGVESVVSAQERVTNLGETRSKRRPGTMCWVEATAEVLLE